MKELSIPTPIIKLFTQQAHITKCITKDYKMLDFDSDDNPDFANKRVDSQSITKLGTPWSRRTSLLTRTTSPTSHQM